MFVFTARAPASSLTGETRRRRYLGWALVCGFCVGFCVLCFMFSGLGLRVLGWCLGFVVLWFCGLWFGFQVPGFVLSFLVWGLGFRVWGVGFLVSGWGVDSVGAKGHLVIVRVSSSVQDTPARAFGLG